MFLVYHSTKLKIISTSIKNCGWRKLVRFGLELPEFATFKGHIHANIASNETVIMKTSNWD